MEEEPMEREEEPMERETYLGDLELSQIKDSVQEALAMNLGHIPLFLKALLLSIYLVCMR